VTSKKAKSSAAQRRRAATPPARSRTPFVIGGIGLLVVGALVAAFVLANANPPISEPSTTPVQVSGTALPEFVGTENDQAVGMRLPSITGIGLDGRSLTIGPNDGATAIVVLAHWCPHCQAELPRLVAWLADNPVPDGVRLVGVSTAIDPTRPNYPPSDWLNGEGWTAPTLIDDATVTAYRALGSLTFPGFIAVNPDGTIRTRIVGEIAVEDFGALLESIAP
jgi:hypothetical protein